MTSKHNLHKDQKTCPQCGQTLPLVRFVSYAQGDERKPIINSICNSCRQRNLEEDTRRTHDEQLDLDYEDLWLRAHQKKYQTQEKEEQYQHEQKLDDELEDHEEDLAEEKEEDKKKKRSRKEQETDQPDDTHKVTDDEDHPHQSNDRQQENYEKSLIEGQTEKYNYHFRLQYEDSPPLLPEHLMHILAHSALRSDIIHPYILNRMIYENPHFANLREAFGFSRNLNDEHNYSLQSDSNHYDYNRQSQYNIRAHNINNEAIFNSQESHHTPKEHQNAATQQPHKQSISSGLFAQSNPTGHEQTSSKPAKQSRYANNSLFNDNSNQPPEEQEDLTNYIKKTWGNKR